MLELRWSSRLVPSVLVALAAPAQAAPADLLPRAALFADASRLYPQVAPDGSKLGWLEPDDRGILQVRVGALDGTGG
jgi:hypothetical protein